MSTFSSRRNMRIWRKDDNDALGGSAIKTQSTAAKTSYGTFLLRKHLAVFNSSEPEAVGVGIVVAGSATVALDKRSTAEFLQAGARGGQSLSRALSTSASVLHKHKQRKQLEKCLFSSTCIQHLPLLTVYFLHWEFM